VQYIKEKKEKKKKVVLKTVRGARGCSRLAS
jgi:hypothetical protein